MMAFQTSVETHRNKAIRYYPLDHSFDWWPLSLPTKKTKLRGLSPHANYTDRAAAAGRRS